MVISITTMNDTRILLISVTSLKPKEAAAPANDLADKAAGEVSVMDTAGPNIAKRAADRLNNRYRREKKTGPAVSPDAAGPVFASDRRERGTILHGDPARGCFLLILRGK